LVRLICTDQYHRDTAEYAAGGFHLLCVAELVPLEARGFTLRERGISPAVMTRVKRALVVRELGHGAWTYQFKCEGKRGCGRDPQMHEDRLLQIVMELFRLKRDQDPRPTRIDLDITLFDGL
jgi:hypothetical protein